MERHITDCLKEINMTNKVALCITITRPKLFKELLESIKKQSFRDFKIYGVTNVSPVGKAKNDVIKQALDAGHELIQIIDDDDILHVDFLKRQVEEIKDNDFISTWGRTFGGNSGTIEYDVPTLYEEMEYNHLHGWMMFKREVLLHENYDPKLASGNDWDLYIRMLKVGYKGKILHEYLYYYRIHDKSITQTDPKSYPQLKEEILTKNGKRKFRFHLLGLAHLPSSKKYMSCAFTQKNRKLAKMLVDLGHEVFFYGAEGSDVEEYCNSPLLHFVQTHTLADIAKDYGEGNNLFEIGYDWTVQDFRHDFNGTKKASTLKFYASCIDHINKVKRLDDFLLVTQGKYHKPIADGVKLFTNCESGIGYRGSISQHISYGNWYRCFESPYIQNFTYGSEKPFVSVDGSYYDRIIPNYFNLNDIMFKGAKKDYYLFIGRIIKRKGIITAYMACRALGKKLIIAGQGAYIDERGYLVDNDPREFEIPPDADWEYVGYADVEKRKELMANAIATFTPTEYLECFGGTHIESMLSGTPPITTDFGVFPYTIPDLLDGSQELRDPTNNKIIEDADKFILGYRCNTLQDFVNAAKKAAKLTAEQRKGLSDYAKMMWSMDSVALKYEKWFNDLYNVYESAVDPSKKGWKRVK